MMPSLRTSCCRSYLSLHFSPPDGRSTRYDRQDFVALACRAQRTVQVRLRAPSGSRLVLTALTPTSPRHVVRNAGLAACCESHAGSATRPGAPVRSQDAGLLQRPISSGLSSSTYWSTFCGVMKSSFIGCSLGTCSPRKILTSDSTQSLPCNRGGCWTENLPMPVLMSFKPPL